MCPIAQCYLEGKQPSEEPAWFSIPSFAANKPSTEESRGLVYLESAQVSSSPRYIGGGPKCGSLEMDGDHLYAFQWTLNLKRGVDQAVVKLWDGGIPTDDLRWRPWLRGE
jgi:hypothetical protein